LKERKHKRRQQWSERVQASMHEYK